MTRDPHNTAHVLDARGRRLSPCPPDKARRMLAQGRARLVSEDPLTVQLPYVVEMPEEGTAEGTSPLIEGRRILLHVCCGPCATYPVGRLREQGGEVVGFWYNPNIHPWREHELRRSSAADYARAVGLPMIWAEGYDMPRFLRLVAGREAFRERCRLCYRMRLGKAAQAALEQGCSAFTTTLLISIHQDQEAIRAIGTEVGENLGIPFLFENFRRGWAERGRLARQHNLYRQQYCGCLYSEWERYSAQSITYDNEGVDPDDA